MSRVFYTESGSKQRNHALRNIALAVHELATDNLSEKVQLDIGGFIVLALRDINATVEQTATAWEKRNYWVKADKFRIQWQWVYRMMETLEESLRKKDWCIFSGAIDELSNIIKPIQPYKKIPPKPPWMGLSKKLLKQ